LDLFTYEKALEQGRRMKRVKLIIHEPPVNKIVGSELNLELNNEASAITVISEMDRLIHQKGDFPLSDYRSLLHMIYNPVTNRFYNQVAVTAYLENGEMVNLRTDPKQNLPAGAIVVLIPSGGCISEWEMAIDYQEFKRALQNF
jgi:hypothetical protein